MFEKTPTGIDGFDALARGGLPRGGVTVVFGGPGTGKTLFGLETVSRGARTFGEPGLFVTFEEPPARVAGYAAQFPWNAHGGRARVTFVDAQVPDNAIAAGEFDLEGLFATLDAACRRSGAERVVFDGLDALLGLLNDPNAARREIVRLRRWVTARGVTAIVTAKPTSGSGGLDSLPFAADCIVDLRHELSGRSAVRTLRVVKYRGSPHASGEFPFAIAPHGLAITSVTTPELEHRATTEKVGSGIERLDTMLGGGYYRGSTVLISGAPGTAKTTLSAAFAADRCARGERTLYVSFDEAGPQIVRNLRSVGIDLAPHLAKGTLRLDARARRASSPDAHVVEIADMVDRARVRNLVIDPISAFAHIGSSDGAFDALLQLATLAKSRSITLVATTLLGGGNDSEGTPLSASTIADTWMQLTYVEKGGERNRALSIVKSRGMSHSRQVRELVLSNRGITLADVYSAGGEVLMGTLRWEKEERERELRLDERRNAERRQREAELALAEAHARAEAAVAERELRRAELARTEAEAHESAHHRKQAQSERRSLRGADEVGGGPRRTRARRSR